MKRQKTSILLAMSGEAATRSRAAEISSSLTNAMAINENVLSTIHSIERFEPLVKLGDIVLDVFVYCLAKLKEEPLYLKFFPKTCLNGFSLACSKLTINVN